MKCWRFGFGREINNGEHDNSCMKIRNHITAVCLTLLIFFFTFCKNLGEVKNIKITIDPKNLDGKYHQTIVSNNDSIQNLLKQIKSRKREITKFFPHYVIEIVYQDTTIIYWGNSNYIEDMNMKTYKITDKDWAWSY